MAGWLPLSYAQTDSDWISLFNGKDLSGWKIKIAGYPLGENYGNTFRVEDGLMTVSYDQYDSLGGRFGHIFYDKPYSHYRLKLEYRFRGKQVKGAPDWAYRNSGIMIHGQSPESMGLNQDYPVSIEVQLLGGDGTHKRPTANVCSPGTNIVMADTLVRQHCVNSSSKTYHGDQWVSVEVEVDGGRLIRHIVNGDTVMTYSKPQLDEKDPDAQKLLKSGKDKMLTGGSISLQAEGHPLQFRNIRLLPLGGGQD